MLEKIPRIKLSNLPTPLDELKVLGKKYGLKKLLIKRDDLTGFAGGGNKARKLEYDFAEVLKDDYDVVLTAGGIQSNHARMTAAAARKLGIDVKVVLGGPDFKKFKGNLLLDVLFSAEIRYLVDDDSNDHLTSEMNKWADELKREGRKPFVLPIGGSTGLGALGYVKAMHEISQQLADKKVQIVMAVGSCGSFAGSILGAKMFFNDARIIGISVSRTSQAIIERTKEIILESSEIMKQKINMNEIKIECYDQYYVEYGLITKEGKNAILECANLEGIILDPIYTGKVMAGMIDLAQKNIIDKKLTTIFLHTGGLPILFSFEDEFDELAKCNKIYKKVQ
ncbi:MAG: D-cysteine desulfhydrase [Ignavibacteriaceae bacterium]|nr:D-cysteine desulfhydrase [Ignavibacteriaceae bacterium]